jgi:guanylate kinase
MKTEKIIICGPSGSGKDFLQRLLLKKDLRFQSKITTRPQRKHESEGVEYFFKTNEQFDEMLRHGEIFTYQTFMINDKKWHYAISKSNFESNQLFIMTPHEINQIPTETRKKCFVVYLDIDKEIRKSRVLRRQDMNDSVTRRFAADDIDFEGFSDYDMRVTESDFDDDTAELIYSLMT